MFSWYTRPGPVSCQFLIPVNSDTGEQGRELLLPLTRGGGRTLGRRSRSSCARRSATGALRPGASSRRRATSPASSASRAASSSRPTRSSRPRATWRCARAPGRRWPRPPSPRDRPTRGRRRAAPRRASTSASAPRTSRRSRARAGCARCATRSRAISDAELGYGDAARRPSGSAPRSPTTSAASAASSPTPRSVRRHLRLDRGPRALLPRARSAGARADRLRGPVPRRPPRTSRGAPGSSRCPVRGRRQRPPRRPRCAIGGVDAVVLTPAHQHPTGVVLSRGAARGAPRLAARRPMRVAIEDDYDAEFRYDRARRRRPAGARRRSGSSTPAPPSKTLAPGAPARLARRPAALVEALRRGEAPRRPRRRAHRAARVRRLPRARRATTATCGGCASRYRAPARRARRGARERDAGGGRSTGSQPGCTPSCSSSRAMTRRRSSPRPSSGRPGRDARAVLRPPARRAADAPARLRADRRGRDRGRRRGARRGGRGRARALTTAAGARGSAAARRPGSRPSGRVRDELPDARADPGVTVEDPEADPVGLAVRAPAPHARPARRAEELGEAVRRLPRPQQLLALRGCGRDPGFARACGDADEPVRRWQRVQWHQLAETSGSVTSKRTPPQLQPPVSGRSGIGCKSRAPLDRGSADRRVEQLDRMRRRKRPPRAAQRRRRPGAGSRGWRSRRRPGSVASTCAAFRSPSSRAASGWTRL